MTSASDRGEAVKLIEEAAESGSRLSKACKELGITERTYYRWTGQYKKDGNYEDKRPAAVHPAPANKLTPEERREITGTCNSPEYASMPPCEIVPALADKGEYIASVSSFYPVLHEEDMLHHRGRAQGPHKHGKPASYAATAPDQVWAWDIKYLHGPVKGQFFCLYLMIDLFSRDTAGWEVWETGDAVHASELVRRASMAQGRLTTDPLVLHSGNGSPMKGATMLETLHALGITPLYFFKHSCCTAAGKRPQCCPDTLRKTAARKFGVVAVIGNGKVKDRHPPSWLSLEWPNLTGLIPPA